jgi:vacuolar-type H+-ATPase subunit C/Vma6
LLNEFAQRDSMDSLVAGLATWNRGVAQALTAALPMYHETNDLGVLEDALDRRYFVGMVRALESGGDDADEAVEDAVFLRQYLRMEIDRINLRAVFQMRAQLQPDERAGSRLLPKGLLSAEFLQQLLDAASDEDAVAMLLQTPYREAEEALFQYTQRHQFAPLERLMELGMLEKLKRSGVTEVLAISVLMHYVWLKYNEVVNLRLIARAQARHLPSGRVREEVLFA